jgi:hypothetical protein
MAAERTPIQIVRSALFGLFVTAGVAIGCHPAVDARFHDLPAAAQLAQLWTAPDRPRDLYWGVGGKTLAPDVTATYKVLDIKHSGFSHGYTVRDEKGRQWSAKFPPEAATEIVASRIHWGIGYHQPPIYLLTDWTAEKATTPNPQLPARFRESKPAFHGLDAEGSWSYYDNPFNGTTQLHGLLVLQAMLGNSDLKDDNNAVYELEEAVEGARKWFVPRDLGHTFGRTGVSNAPRGDVEVFERTPFITGVVNGRVTFDWRGRHDVLLKNIKPSDVRWICNRLSGLTDKQWHDAFRAGGIDDKTGARFTRRLKQKITEGLALKD